MRSKLVVAMSLALFMGGSVYAAQDIHTGTVVVGSGISGLKTAIDLREHKKDVLVVEKMPFLGGTTNLAAQYFVVVDTKQQRKEGKVLSVSDYLKRQEKGGQDKASLLTSARQQFEADKMVDWLNANGADLTRVVSNYQLGISDGSSLGSRLMKVLSQKAKDVGVPIKTNTKVVGLITKDGKVQGVEVEQGKEKYKIYADNVVLATGGFANNQNLITKFAPEWKGLPTTTAKGSTGDAFTMSEKLNLAVKDVDDIGLNPSIHSSNGQNVSMSAARLEGGIMINLNGKRFCDDYTPDYTTMARLMLKQPEGKSFVIIDNKSMQASKRLQGFLKKGYFVEAPTIAELAKKIGVPEKSLEETIKRYASFVKNGKDEDFGRTYNMKTDFSHPPYYATATIPGTQVTRGGLLVNEYMQCVTKDGKAIPNLYAVGETTKGTGTVYGLWSGTKAAGHISSK